MKYQVIVKLKKDFIEVSGNTITVGVMAPRDKGRANDELIRKIAEYFNVPAYSVKITFGVTSKNKIIEII